MGLFDRWNNRRGKNDGLDHLDQIERDRDREDRRAKRKQRRRDRWLFLSSLLGNLGGTMLGTKGVGWVLMAALAAVAGIFIWKIL